MASPTQWIRAWVNSRSWWWTGRPGMLQSMGSQRAGHDWVTELNWTELKTDTTQKWSQHRRKKSCQERARRRDLEMLPAVLDPAVSGATAALELPSRETPPPVFYHSWESPGQQGDQTVKSNGNQPWIFIGRTDAEDEAPVFWSPEAKSKLTGKDIDAGKDGWQKGVAEDVMVGWHHRFNGHEFEQTPGDGEGQGSLAWQGSLTWVSANSGRWWRTGKPAQLSNWTITRS